MAGKVRWDKYSLVQDALADHDQIKLVVVAFIEQWNKVALNVALALEEVRTKDLVPFAQLFLVNAEEEPAKVWELGIESTPAIVFFYEGAPITIRRPDWDDDIKFVGATSKENLISLIRIARDTGESSQSSRTLFTDL